MHWTAQGRPKLATLGPPIVLIAWELVSVEASPTGSAPEPLSHPDLGAGPALSTRWVWRESCSLE